MGELLRAVCDATALDAQTAFYTGTLAQTVPITGALTFGRRMTSVQCKTDTWFLMMGVTMNSSITAAGSVGTWVPKADASQFAIQDAKTSFVYSTPFAIPKVNMGFTLNNMVWLPEYILWPPSSLINFLMDFQLTSVGTASSQVNYVTLTGIEYKMPQGYEVN